jgi:hypothetical protein
MGGITQSRVASLLGSEIDVLVDPAELHSYGLPGLEALASGCMYVCWEDEGVYEYADSFPGAQIHIIQDNDIKTAAEIIVENYRQMLSFEAAIPALHNRHEAVRRTIEATVKVDETRGIGVQIVTPHMRKHGGPTTLATLANLLAEKGYETGMSMVYTDFNPEVLDMSKVPMRTNYKELPQGTDVCIINSDNPFASVIMHHNPGVKHIMIKLSHNARFKETEAGNLNLKWDHIITSTAWLRDSCLTCLPEWEHSTWPEDKVTCVGWYHYGHELFNYHPKNKVYGDITSGMRIGSLVHDHPLKGTQIAIEVVAGLKKKWEALISPFGIGETRAKLPWYWQYYNSLPRRGIADLFRQTDIWLGASKSEGLGRIALEAMSAGAAVVTTDTGAKHMVHEENCLLYEVDDPQTGAELVDRLMQDRVLFQKLVLNGYKTASEAADSTRFITNVKRVIKQVTEE